MDSPSTLHKQHQFSPTPSVSFSNCVIGEDFPITAVQTKKATRGGTFGFQMPSHTLKTPNPDKREF